MYYLITQGKDPRLYLFLLISFYSVGILRYMAQMTRWLSITTLITTSTTGSFIYIFQDFNLSLSFISSTLILFIMLIIFTCFTHKIMLMFSRTITPCLMYAKYEASERANKLMVCLVQQK